jgi:hypothetical protein
VTIVLDTARDRAQSRNIEHLWTHSSRAHSSHTLSSSDFLLSYVLISFLPDFEIMFPLPTVVTLLAILATERTVASATYLLSAQYSGATFLDNFDFFTVSSQNPQNILKLPYIPAYLTKSKK